MSQALPQVTPTPGAGAVASAWLGDPATVFPEIASRWLFASRDGQTLPHAVEAAMEAHRVAQKDTICPKVYPSLQKYHESVEHDLNGRKGFKARRDAEQALAAYVQNVVIPEAALHEIEVLKKLHEGMAACRTSGQHGVGLNSKGSVVENRFQWHVKCRKSKLCPDEARLEGVRIAERYLPPVEDWLDGGSKRRAFYLVMTKPNYAVGSLHDAKRDMFRDFVNFLERIRHNKKTRRRVGNIQGALVVQEDPLSALGDWNVHLNVVLLVDGHFEWDECRKEWGGFNIYFKQLEREDLPDTFRELCKYQAKATSVGNEHAKTKQPGMVDWPAACWLEWWRANHGFRRTRSYGVLYGIPEPELSEEEVAEGAESDQVVQTVWLGRMTWENGQYRIEHYREALKYVDLIQADKSGGKWSKPPPITPLKLPPATGSPVGQGPNISILVSKTASDSFDGLDWGF